LRRDYVTDAAHSDVIFQSDRIIIVHGRLLTAARPPGLKARLPTRPSAGKSQSCFGVTALSTRMDPENELEPRRNPPKGNEMRQRGENEQPVKRRRANKSKARTIAAPSIATLQKQVR
jgi:hypothetical protein